MLRATMAPTPSLQRVLLWPEVCQILRLKKSQVRKLIERGYLKPPISLSGAEGNSAKKGFLESDVIECQKLLTAQRDARAAVIRARAEARAARVPGRRGRPRRSR